MGRVISTKNPNADRIRLSKSIILAIRELMQQSVPSEHSLDLVAFIVLALRAIHDTIEQSVTAWERRGYWVKADRFRLEWEWTGTMAQAMEKAVLNQDWSTIASLALTIGERLRAIKVSDKHRLGQPWVGAWEILKHSK